MCRRGLPLPSCPLLLALLPLLALPAPAARAERFVYGFRPGQKVENRIGLAGASLVGQSGTQMLRTRFRTTVGQTQRVRSVNGDLVTLEIVDRPGRGTRTADGESRQFTRDATRSLVRLTLRGRFISRKSLGEADEGGSVLDALNALYGLSFPARDVKPGESWADTFTIGEGEAAREVRVTTRYVGRAMHRGRDCVRFSSRLSAELEASAAGAGEGTGARGRLTGSMVTYFDPAVGLEVYSSGSVVLLARARVGGSEGSEFVTVTKINMVQTLQSPGTTGRSARR